MASQVKLSTSEYFGLQRPQSGLASASDVSELPLRTLENQTRKILLAAFGEECRMIQARLAALVADSGHSNLDLLSATD